MPDEGHHLANPYDFRNAVKTRERLAGRQEELDELERHIASTSQGRPVHIALIGHRAAGKTSLLNVAETQARNAKVLPVRIDLDEGTVANAFTFFKAFFEAVVQAFVDNDIFKKDDTRYVAWTRQVLLGDTEVAPGDQLLLFGMVAASFLRGVQHLDISFPLLKADADTLASLLHGTEWNAIAILVDEGDLIGENTALIEKLRNLFQASSRWMLIAAGTTRMFSSLSEVFSPIPRQFVRISVEPFTNPGQAMDAVLRPLSDNPKALSKVLPAAFDSIPDIMAVTGGRPYEINLVCYHVWEALEAGLDQVFRLSTPVLDEVLRELSELNRAEGLEQVELIRRVMTTDACEVAAEIIPYHGLTREEIALARLLPNDFTPEERARTLDEVDRAIDDLENLHLIERSGDRFSIRGDDFVRIYLKYAVRLHMGKHEQHRVRFEEHYDSLVSRYFLGEFRTAIFGDLAGSPRQRVLSRRYEYDAGDVGTSLTQLRMAVEEDRPARFINVSRQLPSYSLERLLASAGHHGAVLVCAVLDVGLSHFERAELVPLKSAAHVHELSAAAELWIAGNATLMEKYGLRLRQHDLAVVSPKFLRAVANIADAVDYDVHGPMFALFAAGQYSEALASLEQPLASIGAVVDDYPDAVNDRVVGRNVSVGSLLKGFLERQGFIRLVIGDLPGATESFDRLKEANDGEENWLRLHNRAYISACRGDYKQAANCELQALELPVEDDSAYMILYLPTGPHALEVGANTQLVASSRLRSLLELQHLVYDLVAGQVSAAEFVKRADLIEMLHESVNRLSGWAFGTLLGDKERAAQAFARARALAESGRVSTLEAEEYLVCSELVTVDRREADTDQEPVEEEG